MQNLKERFGTKGNMGEGLDMPDVLAWLEKQGEQKPVQYDIDVLEKHITKDSVSELAHTVIVRNGWEIVEANEQKPAEWSDEDEKLYTSALWHIKNSYGNGGNDSGEYEVYNWLKSIKDRIQPQPKQEWSKEDEKKIMWLVRLISTAGFRELANDKMPCSRSELIDWLKSLIPQNTWKPSEGQLEALWNIIPHIVNSEEDIDTFTELSMLYDELKNL